MYDYEHIVEKETRLTISKVTDLLVDNLKGSVGLRAPLERLEPEVRLALRTELGRTDAGVGVECLEESCRTGSSRCFSGVTLAGPGFGPLVTDKDCA